VQRTTITPNANSELLIGLCPDSGGRCTRTQPSAARSWVVSNAGWTCAFEDGVSAPGGARAGKAVPMFGLTEVLRSI